MIISLNRRFVFIHVHKCAGTSIETALSAKLTVNDFIIGSTAEGERQKSFFKEVFKLQKHSTAQEAFEWLGPARWPDMFSFAFVRHPVDRLRSLFTYAKGLAERSPLTAEEAAAFKKDGTLPTRAPYKFKAVQAAMGSNDFDAFVRHPKTWMDAGAKPQWRSLCGEDGKLLVNFLGKVENIPSDWAKVTRRLKLGEIALGQENRSQARASEDLSPEALGLIEKHYKKDFSLLKYQRHGATAP
jgi:hypothetical protein